MRGIQIARKRACLPCLEDEDERMRRSSVNFASVDLRAELKDDNLSNGRRDGRCSDDGCTFAKKTRLNQIVTPLWVGFLGFHLPSSSGSSLAYISTLTHTYRQSHGGGRLRKAATGWSGRSGAEWLT